MEKLRQQLIKINWENLDFSDEQISVNNSDIIIARIVNDEFHFNLLYRYEEDGIIDYKYRYSHLHTIIVEKEFDILQILTKDFRLKFYKQLNDVFDFNNKNISLLKIKNSYQGISINNNSVLINTDTYLEIISKYESINEEARSYYKKYILFRTNEFNNVFFGIEKERKTLTNPGEFSFLINRFNLSTKKTSSDFHKYLNTNDIIDLQELCEKLIQNEIFNPDFLKKLNDYFIKEQLKEIIDLGRKILNLKSTNIKTKTAKNLIKKIEKDGRKIRQLENVWQKYFEKYLLYLIFSYQKIYPKIELSVNLEKRYPDFIGINHYGGVDIIEIKTHLKSALSKDKSHKNYAFSSELSKAIIQTINYMDALIHEKIRKKKEREDIKGKILEGNIYRPRGIIIISSYKYLASGVDIESIEFKKVIRDFTKLRNGLNNIQILTFDEILNMADNYSKNIVN